MVVPDGTTREVFNSGGKLEELAKSRAWAEQLSALVRVSRNHPAISLGGPGYLRGEVVLS